MIVVQNEMQIAVRQKKLGEPVGDTLQGKTVSSLNFVSLIRKKKIIEKK